MILHNDTGLYLSPNSQATLLPNIINNTNKMLINTGVPAHLAKKGLSLLWFYQHKENCKMINSHNSFSVSANKNGFITTLTIF